MKIKLAFYKGKGDWKDKFIRFWTRSKYSHVELVLGEYWISTSPRINAVAKRKINYHPENWDIVDASNKSKYSSEEILERYEKIKGAKYDWLAIFFSVGIFNLLNNCILENKDKYICSETAAYLIGLDNACKYDPGDLAEWVGLER